MGERTFVNRETIYVTRTRSRTASDLRAPANSAHPRLGVRLRSGGEGAHTSIGMWHPLVNTSRASGAHDVNTPRASGAHLRFDGGDSGAHDSASLRARGRYSAHTRDRIVARTRESVPARARDANLRATRAQSKRRQRAPCCRTTGSTRNAQSHEYRDAAGWWVVRARGASRATTTVAHRIRVVL